VKLPPAPVIAALALAAAAVAAVALAACSGSSAPLPPQPTQPTTQRSLPSPGPREVEAGAPVGNAPAGPPHREAKVVYIGPRDRPVVALTFDTGVDAAHMPEVLDILKGMGVRATFGVTGEWAATNPDLLKRIVAEGHAIVNHSWSHASFTGEDTETPPLSDKQVRDELRRTEDTVRKLADVSTKPFFRPPYGDYDSRVNTIAYEEGYEYDVLWYVDGMGWEGRSTEYVIGVTLDNAFNGAIFLYHIDNQFEYKALEEIIKGLGERGFQLVTIPQLLGKEPIPSPTPTSTPTPVPAAVAAPPPPAPPRPPRPAVPTPTPTPAPPDARIAWDDFESGGSGWLGPWQSGGPLSVSAEAPHAGARHLDLTSPALVQRSADVTGKAGVHMRFWARLDGFDDSGTAAIVVSVGGSSLQTVFEFNSADSDGLYHPYDVDLSPFGSGDTVQVGFYSFLRYPGARWFVDDLELIEAPP
jgi:peptidoglycan/xylan/chitin deacetylase (PgdA/CDA1 family)